MGWNKFSYRKSVCLFHFRRTIRELSSIFRRGSHRFRSVFIENPAFEKAPVPYPQGIILYDQCSQVCHKECFHRSHKGLYRHNTTWTDICARLSSVRLSTYFSSFSFSSLDLIQRSSIIPIRTIHF